MGRINVLSTQVANLIAAGEVVDRPASVVKELIENSIDAHAKNITVEIKNGGVSYIRVSDDGHGITPEDMPLALKRHATSKIAKAEDLNAIFTLGFRGEALAAISSVSKVRIMSKTSENTSGTMLYSEGGDILEVREVGCPNGTTITVEEIFSNVPARRKFLKKDSTEAAAVCASVEKVALSHPEIAFRLISDGNVKIESSGNGKLDHAIYSILGKDFAKKLLPVKYHSDGVDV
ncbi:MAG: DNA mismatch repair endonuclease MutL, partial [Clostridia bacterium]|nr:DNA mismatch repair endonuclease MutL [Clostridia bacterium]